MADPTPYNPDSSRVDMNYPGYDPELIFADHGWSPRFTSKEVPGSNYTLVQDDYYKTLVCGAVGPVVITIPADADAQFPVLGYVQIARLGPTSLTIVPAAGVTLTRIAGAATPVTIGPNKTIAALQKTAKNTWFASGSLTAA